MQFRTLRYTLSDFSKRIILNHILKQRVRDKLKEIENQ